MSLADVECYRELDRRSRSHVDLTVQIQSGFRISRNRGFRCQVNFAYWNPDPRISDGLSPSQLLQIWRLSSFWEIWMGSNGHWISIFLVLCKLLLHAFSSMLFLLRFYPSYPAISIVSINDNNHQHAFIACSIFANIQCIAGVLGQGPSDVF